MHILLSLLGNKTVLKGILAVCFVFAIWFGWSTVKSNAYDKGYNTAVTEYTAKLLEDRRQYEKVLQNKLSSLRAELNLQHTKEVERIAQEQTTNQIVETVTKYVDKEIYITEDCNIVDPDLISMFNQQITRVNTKDR